jgi:endonuclease/exonuclease/phosphatase family metal-dependent hydrolase
LRPSLADWVALDAQLGPDCLRVASYNLHGCVGSDRRRDPARIAEVIRALGCDTVGLQEVYALPALASATRMQAVAGPDIVWRGMHLGNALLTRRRVLSSRHHDYSWKDREPRSILDVELEVDDAPLRVLVAHFGLSRRERRFQVHRLVELLHATPKEERVVILGDLNEWLPLASPLSWLHELLGQTPAVRTFPAWWPIFALDRVWTRPHHSLLAVEAYRSKTSAAASDHLPLRALVGATALFQAR